MQVLGKTAGHLNKGKIKANLSEKNNDFHGYVGRYSGTLIPRQDKDSGVVEVFDRTEEG